jgi:hypothetical protein
MSSCQGELAKKQFYVTAVDQNGNLLVNQNVETLKNGFFELWLPRKRMIDLTIQGLNRAVQGKNDVSVAVKKVQGSKVQRFKG